MQSQSAYWLVGYWVNADFNSLKAARRCFLSSSSRFRSSCSAFISASNLLAEERAWTFTKENKRASSLASEGEPEAELLPDEQRRTVCCTSQHLLGSSVRMGQVLITLRCLGIYTPYLLACSTLTSIKERSFANKSLTSDQTNAVSTRSHTFFL